MSYRHAPMAAVALLLLPGEHTLPESLSPTPNRVTILYDAFGELPRMKKDWGYSAFIEHGGRRILFDTGNTPEVFAENVKTAGVDLSGWTSSSSRIDISTTPQVSRTC